jgi:hypothetical protein
VLLEAEREWLTAPIEQKKDLTLHEFSGAVARRLSMGSAEARLHTSAARD